MSDIVERLRADPWHAWMEEAADEIERLRGILSNLIEHQVPDSSYRDDQSWDLGCSVGDVRKIVSALGEKHD